MLKIELDSASTERQIIRDRRRYRNGRVGELLPEWQMNLSRSQEIPDQGANNDSQNDAPHPNPKRRFNRDHGGFFRKMSGRFVLATY